MNWLGAMLRRARPQPAPRPRPAIDVEPPAELVQDKLPAAVLLGADEEPISRTTPEGDQPVPLTRDTALCFKLTPQRGDIHALRLRFDTSGQRRLRCTIAIRLANYAHSFSAAALPDGAWHTIAFDPPLAVVPGRTVDIQVYAPDADTDPVPALWCSPAFPVPTFRPKFAWNEPLQLRVTDAPRVSIVIPVFNQAIYSYNCLLALCACDVDVAKEVIIVDNGSSDSTVRLLQGLGDGFRVIRNDSNQGFVDACNQGAAVARGEFILFLNNDTQVTPGWLQGLLDAMDDTRIDKQVGIAGSKLVYPDGTLQEAGGIVFNDGSGWNYGRGEDPYDPRYDRDRPVDYCSGACLMIRAALWRQLGGFDSRYAPAYYEDTDLCFAVREAGYQVRYCAGSEVVHHEGVTAGTDTSQGYKAFQVRNHEHFLDKWRDALGRHLAPPPGSSPDQAARRLESAD